MATGDGLLARIVPSGRTIGFDAFAGLCAAARSYGNGIVEITSRGSIQVRGLSAASAPAFAAAVDVLDIDCGDAIPVLIHPLNSLDLDEKLDVGALADALRRDLAAAKFVSRLSAKVSVIVDGGGALHLDELGADIRLHAVDAPDGPYFHVALGGSGATAIPLGAVAAAQAAECVMRLLGILADTAPQARVRDVLRSRGVAVFKSAVADLVTTMPRLEIVRPAQPIGVHDLREGCVAVGFGLPFGHSDVEVLGALVAAARRAAASGLRTAPGRVLLVLGLTPSAAHDLGAQARSFGFIDDPNDPRCRVIACAGAPVCASGQIPARSLAAAVAAAARGRLAGQELIHVSGCAKGCAHPSDAAIAVFGREGVCDIRVDGRSAGSVAVENLPGHIARILQSRQEPERG
jgi:precorrin-3B synthase